MKIVTLLIFLLAGFTAFSQLDLKKATGAASTMGFDPTAIGKGVMESLTSKLGLSGDQTTKVSGLVNQFLTNKSSYIAKSQTKPTEYKSNLEAGQKTLFDGLKANLRPEQFTKLLSLKPATTDKANSLAQLFY
ncbi:MAG: hypothetical protein HOP08_14220 [Cyclobacteriaceae bacterium]|nr:hypothetical protein [Cyclobacteriaceae bacterium]